MILLRLLTLPYVRKHKVRTLLTLCGIALGVVVFVAMRTANDSVLYAFRQTVDRIAGKTELQITAGDSGFPEDVLERVQALREVRVAVPVIEARVDTGLPGQGNILILGVDMTGDRSLREYDFEEGEEAVIDDPLVFLAQPDSIMLTREFAARNGFTVNSRVRMQTMDGERQFVVRGIMGATGLASAFGGNLAVMDIYAAQKVFGRGRTFDRIDLAVAEGRSTDEVKAALEKLLGPGFSVDPPSSRGKQFETIARLFSVGANLNSAFALLIGMFIIYNTFSIAVTQRRNEIGVLRSLGATRGQIRGLFLVESALLGVAGSALGVAAGLLMARGMAGYLSRFLGEVYGVAQHAGEIAADPRVSGFAFATGVLVSIMAAWVPARQAARVDPVEALQRGAHQAIPARETRARRIAAVLLTALAGTLLVSGGHSGARLYVGYAAVVFAALLVTPTAVRWLVRGLRPALQWLRPVEGALAADSLLASPRRTSATVAALMLSLALVVGIGGIARASYTSIRDWLDATLNADLFVGTSDQIAERSFRFPASMGGELRGLPEIEEVQLVRTARINFRGNLVLLVAADVESIARRVRAKVIAGDERAMFRLTGEGKGTIVADNLALQQNLKLGDMVDLPTPTGMLRLPVVGITVDYSDQQGSFLIDRGLMARHWRDDSVSLFRVYLKPGVSQAAAKRRIQERFAGQKRLFVFTNAQLRDFVLRITDQWFGVTYLQIFVAVLVAILGIVNSLTVSIADRRRELGVLQAVGGLRNQVRHTIWMEALSIGWVGLLLGLSLGAVILYYYLNVLQQDFAGIRLEYEYPAGIALLMGPVILAAAFLSALGPAEGAVRGSLVEALEYE